MAITLGSILSAVSGWVTAGTSPLQCGQLRMGAAPSLAGAAFMLLFAAHPSAHAAPGNDLFVSRSLIVGLSNAVSGTTAEATREAGEPDHSPYSPLARTVWWRWTAPASGTTTLEISGSASSPSVLVYTGSSVNALSLVAQQEETFGLSPRRVYFHGLAGTEYQIVVAESGTGGAYVLNLRQQSSGPNDAFANRILISGLTNTVTGHNGTATKQTGEPNHAGNSGGKSLWWTWNTTTNSSVKLKTAGSTFDTLLAVYRGSAVNGLTSVASNDDRSIDQTSEVTFSAKAGTNYQIAVDGWQGASGYVLLKLEAQPAPANDAFADRIVLSGFTNVVTNSISGATVEPGEPSSLEQSVWWSWAAPAFGPTTIRASGNVSGVHTFIGTSISNLTALSSTSANFDHVFFAEAGVTYQIAVDGSGTSSGNYSLGISQAVPVGPVQILSHPQGTTAMVGRSVAFRVGVSGLAPLSFRWRKNGTNIPGAINTSYSIAAVQLGDAGAYSVVVSNSSQSVVSSNAVLQTYAGPPNDDFANRILIIGTSNRVTGSNVFATREAGEPNHAGATDGSSVWWTWTAPAAGIVTLETMDNSFRVLGVYVGNAVSALTPVASDVDDDGISGTGARVIFPASAGTTYQIAVDGSWGDVVLDLRLGAPPPNDAFANRIIIPSAATVASGSNLNASKEQGEPNHSGLPGGRSVWWTWTAPTNGTYTIDTIGSSFDTLLAVYTGTSLGSLALVAEDDESGTNHTSKVTFVASAGATYQIAVDGFNATNGSIALNLRRISAAPNQPVEVAFTGNWPGFRGGRALGLQIVGTLAYVAIGQGGLLILDVGDPLNPTVVGSYDTPGEARHVTVADGFAYVSDGPGGLQIIDVHNPAVPNFAGQYVVLTNVNRTVVIGSIAYVADGSAGLYVLGVSDRFRPVLLDSLPGGASSLVVQGDYAYVNKPGGLQIANVQNPQNIFQVSVFGASGLDLVVNRGYAYLSSGFIMDVVAVTNVLAPVRATNVFLSGNPFSGPARSLFLDGDQLYTAIDREIDGTDFIRMDVSDPSSPRTTLRILFESQEAYGVAVSGSYAFLAAGEEGLEILNLATPRASTHRFETASKPANLAIQGNFAYLASRGRGLQIVDISVPTAPRLVGATTGSVFTVAVVGSYALVGTGNRELVYFDISDPKNPAYIGPLGDRFVVGLATDGTRACALAGSMACLPDCTPEDLFRGTSTDFLQIFDLSDRRSPVLARIETAGSLTFDGRGLSLWRGIAYLAAKTYGDLAILPLDIPGQRFGEPTSVSPTVLDAADSILGTGGRDGIELFDISAPTKPAFRARLTNAVTDLVLAKRRLVAVHNDRGLEITDLSSLSSPVQIGTHEANGYEKLKLAGRYAVVGHGDQGMTILDLGPSFSSAPAISAQPQSRRVLQGATVRFDAGAVGTVPMTYQWRLNGTAIPGATNFVMDLANVQFNQAGNYSLLASNESGFTASSNATLAVDFPPIVAITSPAQDAVFFSPPIPPPPQPPPPSLNITLQALATDNDGTVVKVAFYAGTTLLGTDTNAPFAIPWSNVPLGTHVLTAQAIDNEGAATTSAPVRITVTNVPVFQLSQPGYSVNETNGTITVTVRRNTTGVASVDYATANGSARAVVNGGIGSYYAASGRLNFAAGQLGTNISIQIANDLVNRGDRDFLVQLLNPTAGWFLAYPSNAVVTILDDDSPTNNVLTDVVSPGPAPGKGSLQVTLGPTAVQGRWRLWWEQTWRESAGTISNLAAGEHRVQFMPRQGYRPPGEMTLTITQGMHRAISANYTSDGIVNPPRGALSFSLVPATVAAATNLAARGQWRLPSYTDSNWRDSGSVLSNLPAGAHWVEFKAVSGNYLPPSPQLVLVAAGTVVTYEVGYRPPSQFPPNGPRVLDSFRTITNDFQPGTPYQFGGQLLSDAGAGSGFAVKPRTVLTAAHVVFDSAKLTYSSNLWWFFQRQAGEYEPVPLEPRGSYLFEGYSARRAQDQADGLEPSLSSFDSRLLDVAALFFFTNVARGGYSGHLTTTESSDWLGVSGLKMMIGYPIESIPETNRGRMHEVGPVFATLDRISSDEPVYRTEQLVTFPGNSGGPICVLSTDSRGRPYFIPAGVYLGGDGETVVRAIDVDVVDLINRAERSGGGGGNSTGGGVVPVQLLVGSPLRKHGYLLITVGPNAAWNMGGNWRISPTNSGEAGELDYFTDYRPYRNPYLLPVLSTNFSLEARALPGFSVALPGAIVFAEGTTQKVDLTYQVNRPRLFYRPSIGLGLTGTVGTAYQIERSSSLPGTWSAAEMITLGPGTNWVPGTAPSTGSSNRFYRARWLSE